MVHNHDNSSGSSPSTLLDHSIHVVPAVVGADDDMRKEQVVVVLQVVEEL